LAAAWLARHRRAAVRHLIFAGAFAVLALLPVVTSAVPAMLVPVQTILATTPAIDTTSSTALNQIADSLMLTAGVPAGSRASTRAWPVLSTLGLVATVWLVGVICCLSPVAVGLWQIRRVRRESLPWGDGQALANELALCAGFSQRIDVLVHDAIRGPVTCGVFRPAMCGVYWFHPLIWIAYRQLCTNAERACDDAVLRESPALGYADQLVTLAERTMARTRQPLLAIANRRDLSTRVHAVLNPDQQRGPAGLWVRIAISTVGCGGGSARTVANGRRRA
jgi:beta-lactamase regulating signal transducer with metallopeptidase domain